MSTQSSPNGDRPSRILVVSVRGFRFQAANCCIYEFEDLLGELEGADLYLPVQEFDLPRKIYRTIKYLGGSDYWADAIAPFPKELTLDREYDLLFAVLDNPWQMHLINAIAGWRDKCRYSACYIAEMWQPDLSNWRLLEEPWQNFDRVFLGVTHCSAELSKLINRPVTYIPPAVDTLAFSPYPDPLQRSIDVCYVGRRSPQIHDSLYRHSQKTNFFYYYDTVKKQQLFIDNSQEHRTKLINLFKRSRYNITYYAKFNSTQETGGTQEIGYRFFEGAAAGTVMVGMPPAGEAFPRYFDWEDAIVKVDLAHQDILEVLAELDKQPERLDRIRRQNVANSLLKHDWMYRWRDIIATFDLQPTPAMQAREKQLRQLATKILESVKN
ncbi:glycosyltransferase family protein [Myxosarcina sp. GI1(2024)]